MKKPVAAVLFVVCLGWIACGIVLHCDTGAGFRHWDTWASIGAVLSFVTALD